MSLPTESRGPRTAGRPPAADVAFGERLRKERERRRITLDSIAANTKISLSLLQALERGNVSRWPAGIFRRSFVRAYAQAIGLDPDEIAREFLERFPDPSELPRSLSTKANGGQTSRTSVPQAGDDTMLRLTLAEGGNVPSRGFVLPGIRPRCGAVACDACVLALIGLMLYIAFNHFWMPFSIAVVVYYGTSILLLGNTPGVSLLSQPSVHGRAARLLASPALLMKAVASAIRQAGVRLGEVSSR
jgi:transcriptional regulator with XRE-family HTH domain